MKLIVKFILVILLLQLSFAEEVSSSAELFVAYGRNNRPVCLVSQTHALSFQRFLNESLFVIGFFFRFFYAYISYH